MMDTAKVVAARIDVAKRRAALIEVVRELQLRLQPATIATEVWMKAKNKGADLAEEAVDAVKARPVAAGGIAAALALFLAREPIKDAVVKVYDAMTSRDATKSQRAALTESETPRRKARAAKRGARQAAPGTDKTERVQ